MSGDAHVRICESLGVQFPRATRLYLKIDGRLVYLWRAVDAEGEVLDVLVQTRRNKRAALKLMRKLLKKYGFVPDKLVTDDLRSYGAAASHLGISNRHERGRWRNNRATPSLSRVGNEHVACGSCGRLKLCEAQEFRVLHSIT